ncbi:MAG: acyl-CoA dehydrogenase family protein [Alphaproteobacteria bacterium]|nr:acyl-CoA dehydrogenase family protein [Alphaproteobacteria bacterium]
MILTPEQEQIRETARSFARSEILPHAAAWAETETFPRETFAALGKLGFMGMTAPADWGGSETDNVSYALALEEIAAGDGALSTVMSLQNSVACAPLARYGTAEQKERFLKPLASGDWVGAFCLTEPQGGSDAGAIKTKVVRDGNKWILSGTKQFITSGANADVALVFAVTDPDAGKRGISCFLVPTESAGYTVARREKKMGQRASDTCQILFDDIELTPDLMLGEPGQGYRIALSNLEGGRIGVAAQSVGMARAAFEAALAYSKERESMGKPIFEHQAVGFRLADMATQIEAARLMVLSAATRTDHGLPALKEASMAKLFASEMAEKVCSAAVQIHGGYGYLADYPVERIYRDVRVCQIYEGTSDVQRLVIARQLAA